MQQSTTVVQRPDLIAEIERGLREAPVVVLLGARQVGKTTLSHLYATGRSPVHHFDLEVGADRAGLQTPERTLGALEGLVVLDEVQRMPALFEMLRPLVDRAPNPASFLLLGSASPDLVKGVSESLAGRCLFVHVGGFSLVEVGEEAVDRLWLRGGLPRSFLAPDEGASLRWREAFVSTFLQRDLPQLGIRVPAETMGRFWTMVAHYHGQILNTSELARSLGVDQKTARHYLDILAGTYVVRVLPPWFENVGKRQRKSPKVYVRDSGLMHALLDIETDAQLRAHPKYGASWEGFAIEQTLLMHGEKQSYFWGTQRGAELDLMLIRGGRRYGFEFKCQDAPSMTRSLHIALEDLGLERAYLVYPGEKRYAVHKLVDAIPLSEVESAIE